MKSETYPRIPASFKTFGPDNGILKITLKGDWATPWDQKNSATLNTALSFLLNVNTESNAAPSNSMVRIKGRW
jgi:hypothetical protein